MKRLFSSVTAGLGMVMLVFGTMSAQDAPLPNLPGAESCTVDPIDPDAYVAAIGVSVPPLPANPYPAGTPADEEIVDAVSEVIVTSIACTNVGDLGRLLAVLDPAYAPTLLGVPLVDVPAAIEAAAATSASAAPATPLVDDVDQGGLVSSLLGIANVQTLEDGAVSAEVSLQRTGLPPTTFTVYLVFDEAESRYLITNYAYHYAPMATPAA
jgi:hypothetical protein